MSRELWPALLAKPKSACATFPSMEALGAEAGALEVTELHLASTGEKPALPGLVSIMYGCSGRRR